MIEIGQIVLEGHIVSYRVLKSGSRTILFLHGWRSNADIWKESMFAMDTEGYTSYSLNLPGFGGSETPKTPFGVEDYANIVASFIEKMALGKVFLVGHSFGGRIAIYLAAKRPELVSKLILVDSAGFYSQSIRRTLMKYASIPLRPLFSLRSMQGVRQFLYRGIGADDYLATPELQKTFVKVISQDLSELLPLIKAPTLLLWGANDRETPLSFGKQFEKKISGARLVIYEKAGHFSFLDEPGRFKDDITSFLA